MFPDDTPDVTVSPAAGVVFTKDSWNQPQRVTICAVDDTIAEGSEIKNLVVRSFSDDTFFGGATWPEVTVRVEDNDVAIITKHEPLDSRYV